MTDHLADKDSVVLDVRARTKVVQAEFLNPPLTKEQVLLAGFEDDEYLASIIAAYPEARTDSALAGAN